MPRRLQALLPLLLALLLPFVPAQPEYKVADLQVVFSTDGIMQINHEGFTKSTGHFKTWGPSWQWIDACSLQDNWISLSAKAGDVEASFNGVFQCAFADVSWSQIAWIGLDSLLLELNLTARNPSNFSGMSWDLDLPIALFSGRRVTILLMNGTEVSVKLREEHIPGTWVVEGSSFGNGFGWIVPYTEDMGLVLAVFGEAWPSGMNIHVEDNRQWGGNTYSLRNWLFFDLQLTPGILVRLLVYMRVYRSQDELSEAVRSIREIADMVQRGESADIIKGYLISQMALEEAATARAGQGPPLMLLVYAGIAAVAVVILAFILIRRRGK
ncbi:MAG: hypothetical protein QXW23_06325 [Thermofilaceae archaeon]